MDDEESAKKIGCVLLVLILLIPGLAFSFIVGLAVLTFGGGAQDQAGCSTTGPALHVDPASVPQGPVAGYGHEQLVNAAHVMLAAQKLELSARDQQIGVMTAMGESGLRVLNYGDAVGPDSRGLFQQRDNGAWGTLADRMDPFISATNFFKVERSVAGRDSMAPTLVANAVQRNADPFHYAPYWESAGQVVQALGKVREMSAPTSQAAAGSTYQLGPVQPHTALVANTVGPMFGIKTVGGYRDPASEQYDPNGHPAGLALDFMTDDIPNGSAVGQQLADYLKTNAAQLGVKYIIWEQQIWSVARASEGWRKMPDRGSPTQNHMDHVHLSLDGTPGTGTIPSGGAQGCTTEMGTVSQTGWAKPANAAVTSPFGNRYHPTLHVWKLHSGTDLGAACDAPIFAANAGTVVQAGASTGYGNLIVVDHGGGVVTRYAHMYSGGILVRVGDKVTSGQQIARVGSAGYSTGCHLHFEVMVNGGFVDPEVFMQKAGVKL